MATEVTAKGDTIEAGATHQLFRPESTQVAARYDVSADGQRILVAAAGT